MLKKSKKARFKETRWIYMIFVIFAVVFGILIFTVPSIIETINSTLPNLSESIGDLDVKSYLIIMLSVGALFDLWYFYLITRCANGKSKGTLLLVLLVLRVATGVVNMITTKSYYDIGLIADAVTLFHLLRFKSESK